MKQQILCFGDSNTHGYCADLKDCEDSWGRFSEKERWTGLLQEKLGEDYTIHEAGLSGRTTVFEDPLESGLCGLDLLLPTMKTHQPLDLLVLMLGTNDTKERFSASPACIASGMSRMIQTAKTSRSWRNGRANILLLAPPPIGTGILNTPFHETMGKDCVKKSEAIGPLYEQLALEHEIHFLDMGNLGSVFNQVDFMHLTKEGHSKFCLALSKVIPTLFVTSF